MNVATCCRIRIAATTEWKSGGNASLAKNLDVLGQSGFGSLNVDGLSSFQRLETRGALTLNDTYQVLGWLEVDGTSTVKRNLSTSGISNLASAEISGTPSGANAILQVESNGLFIARFENRESLDTYQNHPDHKETGRSLIACCEGGTRGILVFDYEHASVEPL